MKFRIQSPMNILVCRDLVTKITALGEKATASDRGGAGHHGYVIREGRHMSEKVQDAALNASTDIHEVDQAQDIDWNFSPIRVSYALSSLSSPAAPAYHSFRTAGTSS